MRRFLQVGAGVIVGGFVLLIILVVVIVLIVGSAADEVQEQSDATAITVQEYQSARTGEATRDELVERLGEPSSQDDIQAEGIEGIPESEFSQECLYYNREGEFASIFQFCFDGDGVLRSKSSI